MMQEMFGVKGVKRLLKDTLKENARHFQTLMHDVDKSFAAVDDVFPAKGLEQLPYTGHTRQETLNVVKGVYFEIQLNRMLPGNV